MITIGNSLYMTDDFNVWKVDQYLNILANYNLVSYTGYRGISYNPSNGLIYVVAWWLDEILVFNSDLTLIHHFHKSPHYPWSFAESSNQLYVGTYGVIIIVYQNEKIIHQFNGCDDNRV